MEYAICTVAAAPVRKESAHRSEMVNQLLFGETMQILEEKGEWFRIRSLYDEYEGWLTHHLISVVDEETALKECPYVATGLLNPVAKTSDILLAPMGSLLPGYDPESKKLWDGNYDFHGSVRNTREPGPENLLRQTVINWINAPYLWGGKTFMGVDCSGFVQTVFRILGIPLKRDAYQQAEYGTIVNNLRGAKEGDLAFFQNENKKVTHVGIFLNNNQIIHASGKVRIDNLDEEGIVNIENGKRTHHFHSMKRYS